MAVRRLKPDRAQGRDIVRRAGYDIQTEARKLQEIYLEMADRAYPGIRPQP